MWKTWMETTYIAHCRLIPFLCKYLNCHPADENYIYSMIEWTPNDKQCCNPSENETQKKIFFFTFSSFLFLSVACVYRAEDVVDILFFAQNSQSKFAIVRHIDVSHGTTHFVLYFKEMESHTRRCEFIFKQTRHNSMSTWNTFSFLAKTVFATRITLIRIL